MEGYIGEIAEQAKLLGLEVEIRGRRGADTLIAHGELNGQTVRVDAVWEGFRDRSYSVLQSAIRPELDLGLHVRRALLSVTAGGIPVGLEGFNDEHHVAADEPERARLLLDDHVCKQINAVAALGSDIDLDDTRAMVRQSLGFTEITAVLHALTRVTAASSARFAELPSAGPLVAASSAWRDHAAREGLRFTESPLVMEGPLCAARTRRTASDAYATDVTRRLDEPLDVGIALRPARRLELLWEIFAGADVQVGDAPFDRAFTIAARDPALAAVILDGSVREKIMTLRKEGDVHLGDHGISLRTTHVAEVPDALERMRDILEALWQNVRSATKRGPYR